MSGVEVIAMEELAQRFPHVVHGLTPADRGALAAVLAPRHLQPGEVLLSEGERSDTLYLLLSGRVTVELDGVGVVAEREPGEMVGEVSLLDPGPASATVRALGPAHLMALSAEALDAFCVDHPRVATSILRSLCTTVADRIAASNQRCDDIFAAQRGEAAPSQTSSAGTAKSGHRFRDALRSLFGRHHGGAR